MVGKAANNAARGLLPGEMVEPEDEVGAMDEFLHPIEKDAFGEPRGCNGDGVDAGEAVGKWAGHIIFAFERDVIELKYRQSERATESARHRGLAAAGTADDVYALEISTFLTQKC